MVDLSATGHSSYHNLELTIQTRDTEESAPAEYPPEQPEADITADDGAAYGAEEIELEEGLKAELQAEEAKAVEAGEDEEMVGADQISGAKEEDEENSDAGSEDLEAESSGSEDEEEEEGEEGGDEDMEMADGEQAGPSKEKEQDSVHQQGQPEVMVH